MTGNVEKFIKKSNIVGTKIKENMIIDDDYILIMPSTGFGEVPKMINDFLNVNNSHLKAVIGSGNKNWGKLYCEGAKKVSKKYNVDNIMNFELSGNCYDVEKFEKIIRGFNE